MVVPGVTGTYHVEKIMRASGILMHITSLPSRYGIGTLASADKFIDFLVKSKQHYWQILPINPADYVNSPYASSSAFAGNTLLIDPTQLVEEGLVSDQLLEQCSHCVGTDYKYAKDNSAKILEYAYQQFVRNDPPKNYFAFVDNNQYWLDDYCLFSALKEHFDFIPWSEWSDNDIRMRTVGAINYYTDLLADRIDFYSFCQYIFYKQWDKVRAKLVTNNIKLIGDIPMYVAYDSADVWAHSQEFVLTSDNKPKLVAGVPPDYFSADGQLWGNPLYNWKAMKASGYKWWLARIEQCSKLVDVLRIDHFRAFDSYYGIKHGAPNARTGKWFKGVGLPFLKLIINAHPNLDIIAEDLGDIPDSVLELRRKCGLDGMKILQFAFDGNNNNPFLPHNYSTNCVAYLGTHDNDTTMGWWHSIDNYTRDRVLSYCVLPDDNDINWHLINALSASNANTAIIAMQDIAGCDTTSRMNTPGTLGQWMYMADSSHFSNENAKRLADITTNNNRVVQ